MNTLPSIYQDHMVLQRDQPIPLQGPWRYQVESNFGNAAALHANLPSRLWNGTLAPLTAFPARGILWYQGESNADAPEIYGRLFRELIRDWRTKRGIEVMPFYFVQLPGYGPGSTWPELRAAPAEALELPDRYSSACHSNPLWLGGIS